jgi:hypothetical protein
MEQLNIQKLEISTGSLKWNQNGIAVFPLEDHAISFYSVQDGGNGNAVVFFTSNTWDPQYLYGWDIQNVALINSNGEYVWNNQIMQFSNPVGFKGRLASTPLQFNNYWLTIWVDEREVAGNSCRKVYMQRINVDGTLGDNGTVICLPPTNIVVDPVTYNSAVVSWEGEADDYEVSYRIVDEEWISENVIGAHTFTLKNLTPKTDYQVRVRCICSEGQTSVWSEIIPFTTPDAPPPPPCESPVFLEVAEITTTSAILSWKEGNDQNLAWDLRYREASSSSWNNVESLEERTYLLKELTPNTAYLWTVRANCSEDRTSEWAAVEAFTTDPVGIDDVRKEQMTVYASGKMINIINHAKKFIEKIQLFSIDGKLLGDYSVNSNDNVIIPTDISEMIVFVKIFGKNNFETHKVLVK